MPLYLGVTVDTLEGTFHVPQHKLDDIVASMKQHLVFRRLKVRELARVIGKLVASYRTFGKSIVGLMTRGRTESSLPSATTGKATWS